MHPAGTDRTGALLVRLVEARAAHPEVQVSDAEFLAFASGKLDAGANLETLRTRELFLACACAHGDAPAMAAVERETFDEIEAAHRRFPNARISLDDLRQRMREKLFLLSPPSITAYAGVGALRAWVRASVLNLLINVAQRETREEPTDGVLFDGIIGATPGAEAAYLKLACRADFEVALETAMREMDDRERSLLRHAFVDQRSIDEIGAIYAVHRATAARWIAAAREKLALRTLSHLMLRLRVSEAEARSIVAASLSGVGSMLLARLG
jgi:RNA polymerase sigma-70 factor (ECF subfamily)